MTSPDIFQVNLAIAVNRFLHHGHTKEEAHKIIDQIAEIIADQQKEKQDV